MEHSDPYSSHNSSPEIADDEDEAPWDDDERDTLVEGAISQHPTSTTLHSSHYSISTASSSSSSSPNPTSSASKKKKAQGQRRKATQGGSGRKSFTPRMQERQARGKDPFSEESDSSDEAFGNRFNP